MSSSASITQAGRGARRIRVVIVEGSALMRSVLIEIINDSPDFEVVGAAPDPLTAREMIRDRNPDVITLDVEMLKMDGLAFLEKLMRLRPMPVLMVSTLTEIGSEITLRALELGAVDFISKPKLDMEYGMRAYAVELVEKLRIAARARVTKPEPLSVTTAFGADAILKLAVSRSASTEKLIIVGASTGGTEAIREFLSAMPVDCPGILITQHMPEAFTKSFAKRLDAVCQVSVQEAQSGERVLPGHAYIAPGHSHLLVRRNGSSYETDLNTGPPVNRHRPSVDVLFRSAANHVGGNAVGVILTGMGKDGALGMLEMKQAGAYNFAQDEATCVVFGMPREAIAAGGVDETLPITQIASRVMGLLGARAMRF